MSSADVLLLNIWDSTTLQAPAVFVRGMEYIIFFIPQGAVRARPQQGIDQVIRVRSALSFARSSGGTPLRFVGS
jgi:hypothetical protein